MLCDRCQSRTATVHNITINGDIRNEEHLCEECASQLGYFQLAPEVNFHKILPKFFTPLKNLHEEAAKICPNCGRNGLELQKYGKPGCPQCYDFFNEEINTLLTRIHGSSIHKGKVPVNIRSEMEELKTLRQHLQQMIADENYEEAALIRDKIRSLELNQERAGDSHV